MDKDEKLDVGTGATTDTEGQRTPPGHDPANEGTVGGSGSWNADFAGRPRGFIDPAAGADMGGTESHHRATFSDPAPGFPERQVGSSGAGLDGRARIATGEPGEPAEPAPLDDQRR
jgi:hypothetical protein